MSLLSMLLTIAARHDKLIILGLLPWGLQTIPGNSSDKDLETTCLKTTIACWCYIIS